MAPILSLKKKGENRNLFSFTFNSNFSLEEFLKEKLVLDVPFWELISHKIKLKKDEN